MATFISCICYSTPTFFSSGNGSARTRHTVGTKCSIEAIKLGVSRLFTAAQCLLDHTVINEPFTCLEGHHSSSKNIPTFQNILIN